MKKTLSMAVVLCLLVSLFSGLTISVSAADAVEVGTAAELIAAIAADPAGSFKLTDDITGITAPLTNASTPFTGTLDGDGHSINVNITATDANGTGLFCVTNGATIKNLTLTGTVANNSFNYVAGFVGKATDGYYEKLTNNATMNLTGNISNIAGIVAHLTTNKSVEFSGCKNYADFKSNSSIGNCGGILGMLEPLVVGGVSVTFRNCANYGSIVGISGQMNGGIAGNLQATNIPQIFVNCFNKGAISGNGWLAGIAGSANRASFTNCYNTSAVTGARAGRLTAAFAASSTATSRALTITNCFNTGTITYKDSNSSTVSGTDIWQQNYTSTITYTNCYYKADADGTATIAGLTPAATITEEKLNGAEGNAWQGSDEYDYPLLVSNPEPEETIYINTTADLEKIAANPNGRFKLMTSDLTVTEPLNTSSNIFTGTFNGNGHFITINMTTADANGTGLFSKTSGATIKNLTVKGSISVAHNFVGAFVGTGTQTVFEHCHNEADITASGSVTYQRIGGIAGNLDSGALTGCTNKGDIIASNSNHMSYMAGLVGYQFGEAIPFVDCANFGTLNGNWGGQYVGGIAGYQHYASTFTNCYNTGDIYGNGWLGGILAYGRNNPKLTNCYNLGAIGANNAGRGAGGLTTLGNGNNQNVTGTFVNCYNAGEVFYDNGTASNDNLVFVATGSTANYTNCYLLTTAESTGINGVTAVSAAGLKAANTALGSAYEIGTAYPYPQLKSNPQTLAWGFHLLTVSAGENGSVSYTGTKYVKSGDFALTVTPDEGYIIDEITGQAGYDTLGDTVALTLADAGETNIAVSFAVRPNVAPVVANTSTFTFDGANYIFVQLNKGYGYEDAEMNYGVNWRHPTNDELVGNLYGSGMDANGFFGVKLDGFKGDLRIRSFVVATESEAFPGSFSDFSVITAAE